MLADSDEEGISFDMSPDEADELGIYLVKIKSTGQEGAVIREFRSALMRFCNSRPDYHRKFAASKRL
jgi:hypothetical protein